MNAHRIKPRFLELINEQLQTFGEMSVNECREAAKKLTQKKNGRTLTYYDLKLTDSDRKILLRAARLPFDSFYPSRKFYDWPFSAQRRITNAPNVMQGWVNEVKKIEAKEQGIDA